MEFEKKWKFMIKVVVKYLALILPVIAVTSISCTTTQETETYTKKENNTVVKDKYTVENYISVEPDKYEKFMVNIKDYTTNGSIYHEKYIKQLHGISEIITEKYNYTVKDNSVGFYFDKIEKNKNKFFIGFDIICDPSMFDSAGSYEVNGRKSMEIYLLSLLGVMNNYKEILNEENVEGCVIGFHWFVGKEYYINVWISKMNLNDYFLQKITFKELVMKSTVTNMDGKHIRLTL